MTFADESISPSHQHNNKNLQEHKDLSRCVPILEKVIIFCLIWNMCYTLDVSMYLIMSFNSPADSWKLQLPVCVMWHRVMSEHAWLTEEILAVLILPTETVTVPAQRPQGSLRLNHQTHTYFPLWCVKLLGTLLSLENQNSVTNDNSCKLLTWFNLCLSLNLKFCNT